jgi:hypothetical protein
MQKYLCYFVISFLAITAISYSTAKNYPGNTAKGDSLSAIINHTKEVKVITSEDCPAGDFTITKLQMDSLLKIVAPLTGNKSVPADSTASDFVSWLLRIFGGFLTTIIFYFLHRWFPKIFPSGTVSDYTPGGPLNNSKG